MIVASLVNVDMQLDQWDFGLPELVISAFVLDRRKRFVAFSRAVGTGVMDGSASQHSVGPRIV